LSERIITLDSVEPIDIYGPNDSHLNIIRSYFPKIKIVARGFSIKLLGNDEEVELFEKKFNLLIEHYHKHGHINTGAIERLMGIAGDNMIESKEDANNDVLLFGNNGLVIKARTPNQKKLVESVKNNDMVFAIGPAGW
jgi:phosphate starvation-inducible protein PhoH and related proteins